MELFGERLGGESLSNSRGAAISDQHAVWERELDEPSLQKYIDPSSFSFNDIVKPLRSADRSSVLAQVTQAALGNGHNNFFLCSRNRQTRKG